MVAIDSLYVYYLIKLGIIYRRFRFFYLKLDLESMEITEILFSKFLNYDLSVSKLSLILIFFL